MIDGVYVSLIWAMASNRVIGRGNGLPWKLSTDMQHFRRVTMGKPVVMGRRTFESLEKPLPGRLNVVVTRNPAFLAQGARVAHSLEDAFDVAAAQCEIDGQDELFVIGGAQIYALALPVADRLYVTEIHAEIEGDTWFPEVDCGMWAEESCMKFPAGDKDSHAASIRRLRRVP